MGEISKEKIGNVILDYTYYSGEDLYSEGAAEDRLLDYVKNHTESEFDEFIQVSRSWSVMYHLSHIRENVVSWLPIRDNQTVLEIGSGCGAVTGAFARVAKEVTCVELSKKRSLINAYRNKEYDNLTIMVGNFEDIEPNLEEKYDFITLIGVFEYASSYISGEEPYKRFLDILKKHLKPDGKVIIAIENRLGLKYFAGCKEDHLGQYFAGITGYSEEDGVKTFSKKSLSRLLSDEGFNYKFYYPYPDYKLPHTIYSDDFLPSQGDLNTNLRNFDDDRIVLFDEEKVFNSFIEEGVFPEYSNSFVVMASPNEDWCDNTILPIYVKYADERLGKYRVNTLIAKEPGGKKHVFKKALAPAANEHIQKLCNNYERLCQQYGDTGLVPAKSTYMKGVERGVPIVGVASRAKDTALFEFVKGKSLESYLDELEAAKQFGKMEAIIHEYCNKLQSLEDIVEFSPSLPFNEMFGKRTFTKSYKATNPCNLDMIFANIVLDENSPENCKWTVLDYEWVLDFAVPIKFVIYRSLFYHLRGREDNGFVHYLESKNTDVYTMCGIDIGERMLFEEMEHAYQVYIIGGVASLDVMRVLMPSATMGLTQLVKTASYLRNLDTPKIYFSKSKVFSEENQITQIAKVTGHDVTFKAEVERHVKSLRIDPTEYACFVHINSIRYFIEDGSKPYAETAIVNGYPVTGTTYVFDTDDPQIILEDVPDNTRSFEMAYSVTMVDKVFYDEVVSIINEKLRQEEEEKHAFSYRVKRKLGIIKEDNLPQGYKRVSLL